MIGDVLQGQHGNHYEPQLWRVLGINEDEFQVAMKRISRHVSEAKRINASIDKAEKFVFVGVYRPWWKAIFNLSLKLYKPV